VVKPEAVERVKVPAALLLLRKCAVHPQFTRIHPRCIDAGSWTYNVQHYWVTSAGDTITLKVAVLIPTYPTSNTAIVAIPWGNYRSNISGGTGKFKGATGYLDYFGMADFDQNTLVLRYRGEVCHAH
jgi:hypothetical protein